MGFDKKISTGATSFIGDRITNITRGVDWVFIHCDLITRKVNDVANDVLFSVSVVNKSVSFPF